MVNSFKKEKKKIINLLVEKGIRGGACPSIYRWTKANKKYIKNYEKNEDSSYLQYWNVNNLYGWAMLGKSFQYIILIGLKMLLNSMRIS